MRRAPGGTALDVACGSGRHAALLAELGFRTVAFDHASEACRRVAQENPRVRVVVADASAPPFHDATFRAAPSDEVGARLSARRPASRLTLGRLAQAPEVVAELDARGFARHGFLCGQSGSGKSYATGLILEQLLLETDLPIVVLDPNSDAARLAELREDADPALAERWRAIAPQIAVRRAGPA